MATAAVVTAGALVALLATARFGGDEAGAVRAARDRQPAAAVDGSKHIVDRTRRRRGGLRKTAIAARVLGSARATR